MRFGFFKTFVALFLGANIGVAFAAAAQENCAPSCPDSAAATTHHVIKHKAHHHKHHKRKAASEVKYKVLSSVTVASSALPQDDGHAHAFVAHEPVYNAQAAALNPLLTLPAGQLKLTLALTDNFGGSKSYNANDVLTSLGSSHGEGGSVALANGVANGLVATMTLGNGRSVSRSTAIPSDKEAVSGSQSPSGSFELAKRIWTGPGKSLRPTVDASVTASNVRPHIQETTVATGSTETKLGGDDSANATMTFSWPDGKLLSQATMAENYTWSSYSQSETTGAKNWTKPYYSQSFGVSEQLRIDSHYVVTVGLDYSTKLVQHHIGPTSATETVSESRISPNIGSTIAFGPWSVSASLDYGYSDGETFSESRPTPPSFSEHRSWSGSVGVNYAIGFGSH